MKNKFKVGDLVTGVIESQFLIECVARVVKVGDQVYGKDAYELEYVKNLNEEEIGKHKRCFSNTIWHEHEMKLYKEEQNNERVKTQLNKDIEIGSTVVVEIDSIGLVGGEVVCLLDTYKGVSIGVDFGYTPAHLVRDLSDLSGTLEKKSGKWFSKDEIKTITPHNLMVGEEVTVFGEEVRTVFGREGVITSMGWSPETETFNTTVTFDGDEIMGHMSLGAQEFGNGRSGYTYTFEECETMLIPIDSMGNDYKDNTECVKQAPIEQVPKFSIGDIVVPKSKFGKELSGCVYSDMVKKNMSFLYVNDVADKDIKKTFEIDESEVVYEITTSYKSPDGGDFYSEDDLVLYTEEDFENTKEMLGFEAFDVTFDFNGAKTICTIHREGKRFEGASICLVYDEYDRDLGKRIATHRAIHKMNEHALNELLG